MGNTQGVKSANSPPMKPNPKIFQSDFSSFAAELLTSSMQLSSDLSKSIAVNPYKNSFMEALSTRAWIVSSAKGSPVKLKTKSALGGKTHCVSLHAMNSTVALITGNSESIEMRCLKMVFPLKYLISISKTGSYFVIPSVSKVLPISLYKSDGSYVNVVGIGPFSGTFWEYKCHPESISAVAIKSYSVFDIFSKEVVHLTGSSN